MGGKSVRDTKQPKRALLSVSNKDGLAQFGKSLVRHGFELVSTGGTAAALREAGLEVIDVQTLTGFPEMMDGRVKTLHPAIHAGILSRKDHPSDAHELEQHGLRAFDLVAVNLYPFQETVALPDVTMDQAVEKIDIGGPTMVRAATSSPFLMCVLISFCNVIDRSS